MKKNHFDEIADDYDDIRGVHPPLLMELIQVLGIENKSRVLDVGCGTGADLAWINRMTGANIVGIDMSKSMTDIAKTRISEECVMTGRAEELLRYFDGEFDALYFKFSFQHLVDPIEVLNAATGILRPGGRLAIVTARSNDLPTFPVYGYFPTMDRKMSEIADGIHRTLLGMGHPSLTNWELIEVELMQENCDQSLRERVHQHYLSPLGSLSGKELSIGIEQLDSDLREGRLQGVRLVRGTIYVTHKEET